jgi:hypothetical protein
MAVDDCIVPPGTCGVVRRVYPETNTLIVRFDDEPDVCLVGAEEVEAVRETDMPAERERSIGEPLD